VGRRTAGPQGLHDGRRLQRCRCLLFVVSGWGKHVGVDLSGYKNRQAFLGRVAAREAVQEAMKAEGLLG
jgi:glutathione S-transferase